MHTHPVEIGRVGLAIEVLFLRRKGLSSGLNYSSLVGIQFVTLPEARCYSFLCSKLLRVRDAFGIRT